MKDFLKFTIEQLEQIKESGMTHNEKRGALALVIGGLRNYADTDKAIWTQEERDEYDRNISESFQTFREKYHVIGKEDLILIKVEDLKRLENDVKVDCCLDRIPF